MEEDNLNENKKAKKSKGFKIKKQDIWRYATFIALLLLVVSVITGNKGNNCNLGMVSADIAASNAVNFINNNMLQGEASAELVGLSESNGLYAINISIAGKDYTSYVTKDGKMLFTSGVEIKEIEKQNITPEDDTPENNDNNIPKKDKPVVELFIMSHCPFGTQIEKGFIPVAEKFKDKIDWEIKFVYYAMHGEREVNEQLLQHCIQQDNKDMYLSYLKCFLKDGSTESCLAENNIKKEDYKACLEETDAKYEISENLDDKTKWLSGRFPLFSIHKEENDKYGISGSPSFAINGVKVDGQGRSPQSMQETICNAFTDKPSECDDSLSSANPSSGFGYSESTGAATGSCD